MNEKVLAFDIETWKIIPKGTKDIKSHRPLGITCIGIAKSDGMIKTFRGKFSNPMIREACRECADYLLQHHEHGWKIVAWNSLAFDFDILAEECHSQDYKEALAALALTHTDPGFAMVCDLGYMAGLDAAAKGMGLPGKTEGMSGALAPEMWQNGDEQDRSLVLEYVIQDALTTLKTYEAIRDQKELRWMSKRGNPLLWDVPHLPTCQEAIDSPIPPMLPSWAWDRERFYSWATKAVSDAKAT